MSQSTNGSLHIMSQYLIGYHGDMSPPETPEEGQAHMKKWQEWVMNLGAAIVNPGTPLGASKIVTAAGTVEDDWPNTMFGYSVVEADTLEAACAMASTCPVLEQGGTLRVVEIKTLPGG